jgi:ribosomal protein L4
MKCFYSAFKEAVVHQAVRQQLANARQEQRVLKHAVKWPEAQETVSPKHTGSALPQ